MNQKREMPPYDKRDEESGQFTPDHPDEEFLAAIREADSATTSKIADAVGCKYRSAYDRLNALEEDGLVTSQKVGNTLLWELAEDDPSTEGEHREVTEAPERREERVEREEGRDTGTSDAAREPATAARDEDVSVEAVREYLEENELPPKTAHGRNAALDAWRVLRERGPLSTSELQDAVHTGYEDHWGTPRTMLNSLDDYLLENVPGIVKPGYGEWDYAGDDVVREALNSEGES